MRDHALKWPETPDLSRAEITTGELRISAVGPLEQHLVSGDLAAFGRVTGLDPHGVGALGLASGTTYTARLARDRLLVIGAPPATLDAGWNAGGYAVTGISAAMPALQLSGAGALPLIRRATTLDPAAPGRSATVMFAGVQAVLYRHDQADRFRLHAERGLTAYLWSWLAGALAVMG